jgi:hypothetical protein
MMLPSSTNFTKHDKDVVLAEISQKEELNLSEIRLKLLSKELEDATNEFLDKMARLEKLLAQINE